MCHIYTTLSDIAQALFSLFFTPAESQPALKLEVAYCVSGVISPLLANIYLHEVLDKWFAEQITPRLKGRCFMIRYADDFVMGFTREDDARRVMEVLPKRFGRFGLELHPEKTRILPFAQPPRGANRRDRERSQSFDFLAFTHFWRKSRKGNWVVGHKTAKDRLARSLKSVNQWCRENRHEPLAEQQKALNQKLQGHYAYFGVTGNIRCVGRYWRGVRRYWHRWLRRRSKWEGSLDWDWYERTIEANFPLLKPRIVHSSVHVRNRKPRNRMR
jgi:hypothetical protein